MDPSICRLSSAPIDGAPVFNTQIIWNIVILLALLALSAYFSASETAFSTVNRIRLKNLASDGNKRAARALALTEKYDHLLSTILVGNNIVNLSASALATVTAYLISDASVAVTVSTAILTVAVLVFGEITPKSLAKDSAERFAMFSAPFMQLLMYILWPVNTVFFAWKKLLFKIFKPMEAEGEIEEELLTFVEEAEEDGDLGSQESELIRNAIEFNDIEAIDIHTPRVDVVAVDIEDGYDDVLREFYNSGYSRLPVYQDSIDNIVGVLNQKDFTNPVNKGRPIAEIMTEPVFIIPSLKISQLLTLLQRKKSHLAVIIDEYGGTAGIITLEDVVEELVGEIWDEHDEVVEEIRLVGERQYRVLCSAALSDMLEFFGFEEDEESDISTVAGWVADQLGDIPAEGNTFTYGERMHVTVTRCDGRHATEISVELDEPEADGEEKE